MPMTAPFTFSSELVDSNLAKAGVIGLLRRNPAEREAAEVARGSYKGLSKKHELRYRDKARTALENLEASILKGCMWLN